METSTLSPIQPIIKREFSPEHRQRLSDAKKGKPSHLKGKKLSAEHRKKLSLSHLGHTPGNKGKPHKISGEKHWKWKGGITPLNAQIRNSLEYRIWRRSVFERDNYTCIWCKKRGVVLNADHIKPFAQYPELRFAIDNGRTLCVDCHKTTDTYGSNSKRV